jgi:hypothetical protein
MNGFVHDEKQSNMKLFKPNLMILSHESTVRKPHPSVKTLFYGKKPKNRKNLKKLNIPKINNTSINKISQNKPKYNIPSIQSIINNSKNNEFLSLDENPNNSFSPKIIIRPNYQNSPPALYKVKPSNGNISNNSTNYKNNGDFNNNNIISRINTKISNDNNESASIKSIPKVNKMPKDVKELYKEYIENVSLNIILLNKYSILFKDYY